MENPRPRTRLGPSIVRRIGLAFGLGVFAVGNAAVEPPRSDLPDFEGYMMIDSTAQFTLSLRTGGDVTRRGLMRTGDVFGGYVVERFDHATEVLTVVGPDGRRVPLSLPEAKVRAATANEEAIKRRILAQIDEFRSKGMKRFGGGTVIVDIDGSLLPEARKRNYEKYRRDAEKKGSLFFPVSVDGKWINTFVPIDGKRPDPADLQQLNAKDAAEMQFLWRMAQAEVGARILAGPPLSERPKP